jgi:hypothetical protein
MLLGLLVAALAETVTAQNTSKLDDAIAGECRIANPRSMHPCDAGVAVDQLARHANVLVGFENTPDCRPSGRARSPGAANEILTGISARQAFDHLMTSMPQYSWKEMNGVVVVRPKAAWENPRNPLNLPTSRFEATDQRVDNVLHTVLHAVTPSMFIPHQHVPRPDAPSNRLVDVTFSGGTMLDALNAVVRAHGDLEWQLGYPGGSEYRAVITLNTLEYPGDAVLAPVALPQDRR